jgi:hypothetical protein
VLTLCKHPTSLSMVLFLKWSQNQLYPGYKKEYVLIGRFLNSTRIAIGSWSFRVRTQEYAFLVGIPGAIQNNEVWVGDKWFKTCKFSQIYVNCSTDSSNIYYVTVYNMYRLHIAKVFHSAKELFMKRKLL